MITKVKISNFKSIQHHDEIELKPLTIITGPNSSGKSNLLQGIGVLTQRARLKSAPYTFESSLSRGDLFTYPQVDFVAYRKELAHPITYKMEFKLNESEQKYLESKTSHIGYELWYKPSSSELIQGIFLDRRKLVETRYEKTPEGTFESRFTFPRFLMKYSPRRIPSEILTADVFSPVADESKSRGERYRTGLVLRRSRLATTVLLRLMSRVFFISAMRGEVPISPRIGAGPTWVGKNGEHTLDLLAMIFSKREHRHIAEAISLWAEKFGLSNIGGGWWGGESIGVDYIDPEIKKDLELALASYGSRQVLSLITQVFWMEKGDVLMVEEPEISLHPEHQIMLQELLGKVASEGKQIICTTHSPIFVLGLSKVIKNGILSQKDIRILHTEKTKKGTKFASLQLTADGYVKGWIPSFARVEDKLMKEWSEAIGE